MLSTDCQAVVAGQAGNWGVAVRMRMRPAARGPEANHAASGGEDSRTSVSDIDDERFRSKWVKQGLLL